MNEDDYSRIHTPTGVRLEQIDPYHWAFLDYPEWEPGRFRWLIQTMPQAENEFWVVSPYYGAATHERGLSGVAREMELAREAIMQIREQQRART